MTGFSSKHIALKVDATGPENTPFENTPFENTPFEGGPCIFHPGSFTGRGSEGVNYGCT